jgi:CTP-dependent riboflavin kinase
MLSIDTYPGTLNLEITEAEDLRNFEILKAGKGIEIIPEEPAFCSAKCYPVLIAGRVRGAIVFPCVAEYPKNKMELIAAVHVRETLRLRSGDIVEVEIL